MKRVFAVVPVLAVAATALSGCSSEPPPQLNAAACDQFAQAENKWMSNPREFSTDQTAFATATGAFKSKVHAAAKTATGNVRSDLSALVTNWPDTSALMNPNVENSGFWMRVQNVARACASNGRHIHIKD